MSCAYDPTLACVCGKHNLTDCPFAGAYRKSVQPKWYERIVSTIIAFVTGRW